MNPAAAALWERLRAAGLVSGMLPDTLTTESPWFVRVMLGFAGWIGALFLLFFVGVALSAVMNSAVALLVVGVLACGAASVLFRKWPESDFATQFGLAVSLAGQAMIMGGFMKMWGSNATAVALSMGVIQAVLFVAIANFVHRVWAAWIGALAFVFVLADWHLLPFAPGLLALACAWVWTHEFSVPRQAALWRAGGYGLVLTLIVGLAMGMAITSGGHWIGPGMRHASNDIARWVGAALGGMALLWTVWHLLEREGVDSRSRAGGGILAATLVVALVSLKAPGLAPALLVLLLGQANGNAVLRGIGVFLLLGYLAYFYYSLATTLLYKSALMAAAGVALLAVRFALGHWLPAEDPHA